MRTDTTLRHDRRDQGERIRELEARIAALQAARRDEARLVRVIGQLIDAGQDVVGHPGDDALVAAWREAVVRADQLVNAEATK